jgi:hypothetical protein
MTFSSRILVAELESVGVPVSVPNNSDSLVQIDGRYDLSFSQDQLILVDRQSLRIVARFKTIDGLIQYLMEET